jgi:hypothetical protein
LIISRKAGRMEGFVLRLSPKGYNLFIPPSSSPIFQAVTDFEAQNL